MATWCASERPVGSDRVVAREWFAHLLVIRPGTLPEWTGAVAMAGLLAAFSRLDESCATRLHDVEGTKPYTVSPLSGIALEGTRPGRVLLEKGSEVAVRLTAVGDAVPLLADLLGCLPRQVVLLDRAVAEVTEVRAARTLRLEDLLAPAPGPTVRLRFLTPTAFKRPDGALEVLPQPGLVLGGAAERWRRWVGQPPSLDASRVWVRSHRLRTVPVRLATTSLTGFVGVADLQGPADAAQSLWALCRYLEMVGCGVKAAQGMGQVIAERPGQGGDVPPRDRTGGGPLPTGGAAPGRPPRGAPR